MEINPASVFDVQKLGVEQISKSSGYVTALQKPLKKMYFPYKKNFALNPPLPYHKIVAGPQGITFSPESPTISTLPPNGSQQLDKQFPKESIISTLCLQFEFLERNKKFKGAFVTLDKEDRIKQAKEYGELFVTIDEKDHLMTSVQHPALFICIAKPTNSKHLEAHIFICLNDGQALDILRALKGEPVTGQTQCSEIQATNASPPAQDINQGTSIEPHATPLQNTPYPAVSQQQYTSYPPSQQSVPTELNLAGYEQMFYNMRLNAPAPQAMPAQSTCLPNQATPTYPPPIGQNYYPEMNFGYLHPTNPNPQTIPYNPVNIDGGSLTIPRPCVNSSGAPLQEMSSDMNDSNFSTPGLKFPRPVVTSQSHQLPSAMMNSSQSPYPNQNLPQNTFQNQAMSQNPYLNQALAQNVYPTQTMPQNVYPTQTMPQNCYPTQTIPQTCYPNQTMPQNAYPNQASSQNAYPNQASSQNAYPNQASSQNAYPNQASSQNAYPNQAISQNSYPNQASSQNAYPNQASSQNAYPNQAISQNAYPNQAISQNVFPNPMQSPIIYPNLQPVSNLNFQQPNQPYPGGANASIPYSSAQPNNQQTPAQGNRQSSFARPTGTPTQTEKPLNPRLSMASAEMNISGGQKMSLSEEPSSTVNQVSPLTRPNVPSKPSRTPSNLAGSNPGLKQPKKIIGIRVMPALPNNLQITQSKASNEQAAISDVGNKAAPQELSQ